MRFLNITPPLNILSFMKWMNVSTNLKCGPLYVRFLFNIRKETIGYIQKTTFYFLSMFVTMSIKRKTNLVHVQKYIGDCEYVEIGES